MISKKEFNCNECEKHFEIKGYWFNQIMLEWYLNYKFMWHGILKHKKGKKWTKKRIRYFILMNTIWIPLVILQVIDILLEPFRRIV